MATSTTAAARPPPQASTPSTPPLNPNPTPNSRLRIHYISDHTLHLPRNAYLTARAEKDARATLYSAVKRALGRDDIVILDSGNYIKGWRYQLHCEAKALGTPSCVVHIGTSTEGAREVNAGRLTRGDTNNNQVAVGDGVEDQGEGETQENTTVDGEGEKDPYSEQAFEELVMRFEEPNAMARWDSPLFTVLWDDPMPPCAKIWEAVVESRGGDGRARVVRPNQATMLVCFSRVVCAEMRTQKEKGNEGPTARG